VKGLMVKNWGKIREYLLPGKGKDPPFSNRDDLGKNCAEMSN
jgi:hypothetical protein